LTLVCAVTACRFGFDEMPLPDVARITIQHGGSSDLGVVVGPNGFTCSSGTCTLEVDPGTPVTLRGLAADDAWFAGWTTNECGGNFDCALQADGDITILADFTPTPNRVFVTSTTTDAAFGGIAGADAICAARATAANLSGTFIAFISDTTTNAATRLAGSRGWVRTDGAPFADAPTAFANGKIVFPPRLDEYGNDLGNVPIYTGTNWGLTSASLCTNWTTNLVGQMGAMANTEYASSSIGAGDRACSTMGHLLCVETGRIITVATRPDTGKQAFSTKIPWVPGGGRASADAHCASEAAAAGLTGDFLAAVATTTESIESRFTAGDIYRRIDGVRLLRGAGILAADWLDVPPEADQYGERVDRDLWTGVTRFNELPNAADNCSDWTVATVAQSGMMHFTTRTDVRSPTKTDLCSAAVSLLCLER